MLKWRFPEPAPDEALIAELKHHVEQVAALSKEAQRRGITVWLRRTGWDRGIFKPEIIVFDGAYRTKTDKIA